MDQGAQELVEITGLRLGRLGARQHRRPGCPIGRRPQHRRERQRRAAEVCGARPVELFAASDPIHHRSVRPHRRGNTQPDPIADRRLVEQHLGEGVDPRPARCEVRCRGAGRDLGLRSELSHADAGQKAARRGAEGGPSRVARDRPIPRGTSRGCRQRRAGDRDCRRAQRMCRQRPRGARERRRGKQRRPEQEPRQRCVHGGEINPPGPLSCKGSPRGGGRWPESAWADGSGR